MPENTNNDAPGTDRPTSRLDQEAPSRVGATRPPGETEAERQARDAVREAAKGSGAAAPSEAGSPTDTAP